MQNKLCMLLLLFAWLAVTDSIAQIPRRALTPEQERQNREVVEINKMLLMRQNPPTTFSKEKVTAKGNKQEAQLAQDAPAVERLAAARQRMNAYFKAHPEQAQTYNWGGLPEMKGAAAVMEAQGVTSLQEVQIEKLSEVQKDALFETEPALQEVWKKYEQKLALMDAKSREQLRQQLWDEYKNNQNMLK